LASSGPHPDILDFPDRRGIRKVVFAHLVCAGRGNNPHDDLTQDQKRRALDLLLGRFALKNVLATLGCLNRVLFD